MTAKRFLKYASAFVVGGITGMGGEYLYSFLLKNSAHLISRMFVMANYGIKSYILNTLAKGQRPTARGFIQTMSVGGISKDAVRKVKSVWSILRTKGSKAAKKYLKR